MADNTSTIGADTNQGKEQLGESEKSILVKAIKQEVNTMPYVTASTCNSLGVQVPTKLAYDTNYAINKFVSENIDTTNYVLQELKYKSRIAVCEAFAAEQIDAIALAIRQMKEQKGFILGDMAGIGKGRVCAGILRYAKVNNIIPIFITFTASLFSDIYNDFKDIGGIDEDGNLPNPFIFNSDGDIQEDVGNTTRTAIEALSTKKVVQICRSKKLPIGTDCVFLTYSQLSQDTSKPKNENAILKLDFLKSIASNSIFALDESHKGAGAGNIAENLGGLIANSFGTIFASATYAKNPRAMLMYIPKTDIRDSKITPSIIVDAVRENGEVVQEYVASLLVKSGQMIRRERSYDGCDIDYDYVGLDRKDEIYGKYDKVMELYTDIEKFVDSSSYTDAVKKCIERYAAKNKIEVVYSTRPIRVAEKEVWDKENKLKWTASLNTTNTVKGRFQWTQNLLFSLKADAVADETIKILQTQKEVAYNENGKEFKKMTNYKPIISVRNTAEASLRELGYKVGDIISKDDNDYSKTLIRIAESIISGKLVFTQAVEDDKGNKKQIKIQEAIIEYSDFNDNGLEYDNLKNRLANVISGIPLSPIDHINYKIRDAFRKDWDDINANPNFKVEEITKRSLVVAPRYYEDEDGKMKRMKDGSFVIMSMPKSTTKDKVSNFNRGETDVILLNTAGSTGLSMHSKINFYDRRPRIMLIHQVELDVNVEVQKRGRIFRTGQVNLPAYKYMVSVVPIEIRSLLMLKRKLRSLDANTSGNVKQSAKASEIRDREGNVIEDISNKYGLKIILEFVREPKNIAKFGNVADKKWQESGASDDEKVEQFTRKLEQMACQDQEDFYNDVNAKYVSQKQYLIDKGEWDLDTNIELLEAAIRNKRVVFYGNDYNEFTKSVFIEDKWVNPKGVPFTKEEILEELTKKLGGKTTTEYQADLIQDFNEYALKEVEDLITYYGEANVENKSAEEAEKIIQEHKERVDGHVEHMKDKLNSVKFHLEFFVPSKVLELPVDLSELEIGYQDASGLRKTLSNRTYGYFVGYKFLNKSDNKYSPMNIELQFATPSRDNPKFKITLTNQYEGVYRWIEGGYVSKDNKDFVTEWKVVDSPDRPKIKVLTGELFKGLEMSKTLRADDANFTNAKLIKFSTLAGGVESGIRLGEKRHADEHTQDGKSYTPINSDVFLKYFTNGRHHKLFIKMPNGRDILQYTSYPSGNGGEALYHINTGITETQRDGWTKRASKDLQSDNCTDAYKSEIQNKFGLVLLETKATMEFLWKGSIELKTCKTDAFGIYNNSDLKKLFDWLFYKHGWLVSMTGEQDYLYTKLEDPKKTKTDTDDKGEGVYKYHLIAPYSKDKIPPNFIDGSYLEAKESGSYGILATKFILTALEASRYNLVPFGITEYQAVQNILKEIGGEQEQNQFKEKVRVLANDKDYHEIAIFAQEILGVLPRYAIGKVSLPESGRIIANNIDAKPSDTSMPVKESEEEDVVFPLDFQTAQDFIIKLKSL